MRESAQLFAFAAGYLDNAALLLKSAFTSSGGVERCGWFFVGFGLGFSFGSSVYHFRRAAAHAKQIEKQNRVRKELEQER